MDCYCNSKKNYNECCYPFLSGSSKPESPEELMRSRYSAFCIKDIKYLISTHHPSRQGANEAELLNQTFHNTLWIGLKILNTEESRTDNQIRYVEFAAFYQNDPIGQLHENSRFIYENEQWFYLDGVILDPLAFGRNELCWCGSNKKYKKCHGKNN